MRSAMAMSHSGTPMNTRIAQITLQACHGRHEQKTLEGRFIPGDCGCAGTYTAGGSGSATVSGPALGVACTPPSRRRNT